ncbi:hypothetical protein L3Q82_001115 [Scortum barcoo]|uniref:Uncharacterized protein n=1 Tax=Scortum barcoo TaxID=214431 RepID=A0ACB8WB93_9TELE|nr:hypothetical protein L3Q82_001115 [Scortum barcoo]
MKACVTDRTPIDADAASPGSQHFDDCREIYTYVWTPAVEAFFLLHVIMRWLLAGYCGFALLNILVANNNDLQIKQQPFFYGTTTGQSVTIVCHASKLVTVDWYKAPKYNSEESERKKTQPEERIVIYDRNLTKGAHFRIDNLRVDDSGVYFCKINNKWGPGTEVQVARPFNRSKAQNRTNTKDGLIILQALLLAACIGALVLRKRNLVGYKHFTHKSITRPGSDNLYLWAFGAWYEKRDSIYEEPETDHIYEGLAIETCGGGLYEELSVYAQAEGAEAPWE